MADDPLAGDMTDAVTLLSVEICHALPDAAFLETLTLRPGATIADALKSSRVLAQFPALAAALTSGEARVGIFGKVKTPETVVRDGDRIEVYRPLQADPKESRRRRAQHKNQAAGR